MATDYYTCPNCKTNRVHVSGRNRSDCDRQLRRAQADGRVCDPCFKARCAAERNAEAVAAASSAEMRGLPPISGVSDAQRRYGEAKRGRFLNVDFAKLLADEGRRIAIDAGLASREVPIQGGESITGRMPTILAELADAASLLREEALQQTSAKFWIEDMPEDAYGTAQWLIASIARRPTLLPTLFTAE